MQGVEIISTPLFCRFRKVPHIRIVQKLTMEEFHSDFLESVDLEVDGGAANALKEGSKWAKFISILVFVFCGIAILIFAAAANENVRDSDGVFKEFDFFSRGEAYSLMIGIVIVAVLLVAGLYALLMNFGVKTGRALASENIEQLNKGLGSLKLYFIIYGCLSLLTILFSIYSLINSFLL
ncbi:hypothetical protein [Ferruginibacter sp.]